MLVPNLHSYILIVKTARPSYNNINYGFILFYCFESTLCSHLRKCKHNCCSIKKNTLVTITRWQLLKGMQPRNIPGLAAVPSNVMWGQIGFVNKGTTEYTDSLNLSHQRLQQIAITGLTLNSHYQPNPEWAVTVTTSGSETFPDPLIYFSL